MRLGWQNDNLDLAWPVAIGRGWLGLYCRFWCARPKSGSRQGESRPKAERILLASRSGAAGRGGDHRVAARSARVTSIATGSASRRLAVLDRQSPDTPNARPVCSRSCRRIKPPPFLDLQQCADAQHEPADLVRASRCTQANLPGYPASHGCVRLPLEFSRRLFEITHVGTPVIIAGNHVDPSMIVHPGLVLSDAARDRFRPGGRQTCRKGTSQGRAG